MDALQRRLEDELVSCLRQIQAAQAVTTTDGTDARLTADPVDRIQASGIAQNHAALASRAAQRVEAIRAALARVAEGSYGVCVACAKPIGAARLRVMPEAATCVGCQERRERSGGSRVA
jgi:RNA polymerase-binding transcription factor DksA